jgi:hypothetical protein
LYIGVFDTLFGVYGNCIMVKGCPWPAFAHVMTTRLRDQKENIEGVKMMKIINI